MGARATVYRGQRRHLNMICQAVNTHTAAPWHLTDHDRFVALASLPPGFFCAQHEPKTLNPKPSRDGWFSALNQHPPILDGALHHESVRAIRTASRELRRQVHNAQQRDCVEYGLFSGPTCEFLEIRDTWSPTLRVLLASWGIGISGPPFSEAGTC